MRRWCILLLLVAWVSTGTMAAQSQRTLAQLTLEATFALDQFTASDCEDCLIRLSGSGDFVFIIQTDQQVLWQYTKQGKLVQRLDLLSLPIEPPVPVKQKVRVTDFAVLGEDILLLAEMNTASVYRMEATGKILQRIPLENSPQGLLLLSPTLMAVYDQVFTRQYVRLLTLDGDVRHTAPLEGPSGVRQQPGGLLISVGGVLHLQAQDGSFFLVPPSGTFIFHCQTTSNSLACTRFVETEDKIQQIGYASATLWYTTESEKGQTHHMFDVRAKRALGTGAVPAYLQGGGVQIRNRYYTLHNQTLRCYTYE